MTSSTSVRQRLEQTRARIAAACQKAGREADSVRLVAISKTFPAEFVRDAFAAGQRDFGENRVQEATGKIAALEDLKITWHLVGHLQSNKAGPAVKLFNLIHSVDSETLAREVDRRARAAAKRQRVLVQVNCSGEASKSGCRPEEAPELAGLIERLDALILDGFMTIGPLDPDPESTRAAFRRLRTLKEQVEQDVGRAIPHLSMGMSGDFEMAIEEGATLVRIGSAIFGERLAAG